MRRLAIAVVFAGVCAVFASRLAAAPVEEELLFDTPATGATKTGAAKQAPAVGPAKKAETGKTARQPAPLNRRAGKAMASAHRRMPAKARPLREVRTVNPTAAPSFYIGVHFGGGWTRFHSDDGTRSLNGSGVIGGGQFGVNYQVNSLVFGLEADVSASGVRGSASGDLGGAPITGSVRNDWFATFAGRLGFASGQALYYLKAGGAWTRYDWDFNAPGVGTASGGQTRSGWMIGAGFEQAITGALSAKIEYNYMNFGNRTETLTTSGGLVALPAAVRLDVHVVKLGFNHRFAY